MKAWKLNLALTLALIGVTATASAETFQCYGTGRFAEIGNVRVNLKWKKQYQKVLIENETMKAQVYIDKSNSDGSHYLGLEFMDLNQNGVVAIRSAKGSLKDMVQYFESPSSSLSCIPIGVSK